MPHRFETPSGGTIAYQIDPDCGLALIRPSGAVTGRDLAQGLHALQADSDWHHHYALIWDERGITSLDVTPDELDQMVEAQEGAVIGPDLIVTTREDYEDLFQLYAWRVQARGHPASVCRSLQKALALVGLDALPESMRTLEPLAVSA